MLTAHAWGEQKCCGVHPPGNSPQPIEGGAGESVLHLPVAGTGHGGCTYSYNPRPHLLVSGGVVCSISMGPTEVEHHLPTGVSCSLTHLPPLPSHFPFFREFSGATSPKLPRIGILASVLASEGTQPERQGHKRARKCLRLQSAQRRHHGERESEKHSGWPHIWHLDPAVPEGGITLGFALREASKYWAPRSWL